MLIMDERDKKQTEIVISSQTYSSTELEKNLGITKEYNQINRNKLWDSASRKKAHKEKIFGEKATHYDTITGEILHKSRTAAQKKYHMRVDGKNNSSAWAKHATNTDHIVPLKTLHKRFHKNPFLSDKDLNQIANQDANYREVSQHFNTQKGDKSDLSIALDPNSDLTLKGRSELLKGKVNAELILNSEIAAKTVQNASKVFAKGAQNALAASAIPLVIRGSQDLLRVANREMTIKDAVDDLGTLGISIAASGGSIRIASVALSTALKDNSNLLIKRISDANQLSTILVISSIIVRATGKYLDGEVDTSGFFQEITESGMFLVSGMLASKATVALLGNGATVVPVLAAMIASTACSEIYSYAKKVAEETKRNEEIRCIAAAATSAIKEQQDELYRILKKDHKQWAQQMTDIFQIIAEGISNTDLKRINDALQQLMCAYGSHVKLYGENESVTKELMNARNDDEPIHII